MLNIVIWGKFFAIIIAHQAIRKKELYAQIMYEQEDHSKQEKAAYLETFKKTSLIMNIVVAVIVIILSIVYIYFAVSITQDIFNPNPHEKSVNFYSDYNKTRKLQWIISLIFAVLIIGLSLSLMVKLKVRFEDFYKDYGCFLWTVFAIQALSLIM